MSRKTARENTFKLVFEYCVNGELNELTQEKLLKTQDEDDNAYTKRLLDGIILNQELLKRVVTKYSTAFVFERVYKIDLAILYVAMYEILFTEDIPFKVSINEALELAKIYSTDKSSVFINGILASVINNKEEILNESEDN